MAKIKVIIKRPDEKYGHVTNISTRLENLQKTVEGYIEAVPVTQNAVILCNEEGKIKNLEHNIRFGKVFPDVICGTLIVIGVDGEDFCDVPIGFRTWKMLLEEWGN